MLVTAVTGVIGAVPSRPAGAAIEQVDMAGTKFNPARLQIQAGDTVVWEAGDDSWRERDSIQNPVRSGAESFIAGTASCRIRVDGIDALYEELRAADVLHPVSRDGVSDEDYGAREFATLDADGNLVTFFEWVQA